MQVAIVFQTISYESCLKKMFNQYNKSFNIPGFISIKSFNPTPLNLQYRMF
jgi:hypothetical protein